METMKKSKEVLRYTGRASMKVLYLWEGAAGRRPSVECEIQIESFKQWQIDWEDWEIIWKLLQKRTGII